MDDETLIIIGAAAVGAIIFKKEIGGLFQGPTTALTGTGQAIATTAGNIASIGTTTTETANSWIELFNIKRDLGMFINFFQNLNSNNVNKGNW